MSSAGIALGSIGEDLALSPYGLDGFKLPHYSDEAIMIYLSVPGSSMVPMRVLESDSIASVKLKIQNCKGFMAKKQRLVCDGRELSRNNSLVKDYGVGDGKVLHLVVRISDLCMITVETTCGKIIEFHADQSRNVAYIKQQIVEKGESLVDLNDKKLICDGEVLDDQVAISDLRNNNDSFIHVLVCESAKINSKPVEKGYELSIEAADLEVTKVFEDIKILDTELSGRKFLLEPFVVNPKIELTPVLQGIVRSVVAGLDKGKPPIPSTEGSGGAYFMQDVMGHKYVAVFKPNDEEPMAANNPRGLPLSQDGEGLKRGTRVGEGALREVAAYILDHPASGPRSFGNGELGFAGVPPTLMVRCLHEGFHHPEGYQNAAKDVKIGSLQMFMKNQGSCEDMGPRAFPVQGVHKISVLDIRLANADRHGGNILVQREGKDGQLILVPIDHGYCLPESFEDCTFEWLYWPQAKEPYNSETVAYVRSLDAEQDIALLKLHGWKLSVDCARTLRISTMLLKKGVERGLTPFTIGNIMCRETVKKESMIEEIVHEAKEAVLPCSSETGFMETVSEIMDRHLDSLGK